MTYYGVEYAKVIEERMDSSQYVRTLVNSIPGTLEK